MIQLIASFLLFVLSGVVATVCADPIISEFLASNDSELADEDGEFSDWIEIHNPDAVAVNMGGWHLTDNATNLDKWTFPNVTIPAGGYLVVFASNKDRAVAGQELHTDFRLSSEGEYLALVKPDGVTKTSEFNPYPAQSTDVSYGVDSTVVLLGTDAALRYTLTTPPNDAQGDAWTEHDFDDSGWTSTQPRQVVYNSPNVPRTATKPSFSSGSGVATSTVNVAGQASPVSGVKLRFNISRDGGSSLLVQLTSPQGTTITVFNNGSNSTSFEADLTAFNTQNLNGNWTLRLTESGGGFFQSRSSTLNSWSLEMANGTESTTAGIGYDNGSDYDSVIKTSIPAGTTEAWVRFPFQVTDPSALSGLLLKLRYDDGFEAYINGTLVDSNNNTPPISSQESNGFVDFDIAAHHSALRAGTNVLAIRLINASSTSSDLLLIPELQSSGQATLNSYVLLSDPTPGVANQGGAINPGPIISDVTENPSQPSDSDNLVVTARVQQRQAGIASVKMFYRVDYNAEVMVTMVDNGTGGDATAGDGIYSATIPASASTEADMVRWRVEAEDTGSLVSRMPLVLDTTGNSQSPEYYGTVVAQPSADQGLPIMYWYTQNVSNSRNRTGARASVFYQGKFYDNIYVRQRGGFTNNGSQKFDFNKGHPLFVNADMSSVGEVNMNAQGNDSSFVRQPMGFQFHHASGNPGCIAFPVNMRLNGSFDRVGILIEQVDEDFLKRYGYDEDDGELYKLVQRSNLNPVFDDTSTGVEKKTGDENDLSSLQSLVNDLKQSDSNSRITSFYDNIDQQEFINYMAIRVVQQQADDVRKNFYVYKDSGGDGRWRIFPWDLDFTWDIVGGHGETRVDHPFFGIQDFPTADGNDQWNRLYDVAFEDVTMQRLMLRRLRTLMDDHLKTSPTGGWFEPRIDSIFNSMSGLSGPSNSNGNSLRDTEVPERRNELFNSFTSSIPGMSTVIPASQPASPSVAIDQVDFNPSGGDQDQEYIRITNSENTEIDISGWSLSSGVEFTFPAGTVIPRNGELYVSPKLEKFVTRASSPKGGEKRLVTGPYSGHLSSFGEDVILKNGAGGVVQTFSYTGNPSLAQQYLVISEIHYAPVANADAEFIEVMNISTTETIDLTGVVFTNGVDFGFTGSAITSLAPGEVVLVVKNQTAFEAVYGTSVSSRIAGQFANGTSLNNGGESLKLDDSNNATIHSFSYDDQAPWPVAQGASLVLLNPSTRPDHGNPANWAASSEPGGHPAGASAGFTDWLAIRGQTDPLSDNDGDGWNELLTYGLGLDLAGASFVYASNLETFNVGGTDGNYLTLESTVRNGVNVVPQVSTNLSGWTDAVVGTNVILVSNTDNGNGTSTVKYRLASAADGTPGESAVYASSCYRIVSRRGIWTYAKHALPMGFDSAMIRAWKET